MKANRSKRLWAGTATAGAVAVLGLALQTTSAPADSERRGAVSKTIKMVLTKGPQFQGPQRIVAGGSLEVVNKTRVQEIGPHTFSLFTEDALPNTNSETRKCGMLEFPPCALVAKAHGVSPTFKVHRPSVDRGLEGWDRGFTAERQGDTWYTEQKGDSESRVVTASPGSTLHYICVVHPDTMRGSIEVIGAR